MDEIFRYFQTQGVGWVIILLAIQNIGPYLKEYLTGAQKQRHEQEMAELEAKKKQEDRMYILLDKFSDRLEQFSLELAKLAITNSAIFTRLDGIDKIQSEIRSELQLINDKLPRSARTRMNDDTNR